MDASNGEREMTRYQRNLVDTCFEEGQYEPGIALLDQLRSASFKPPPDHIRQLLYIALFPPPPATGDQINHQEQVPCLPSPTKQKATLSKASLSPSVTDSDAAQRILFSFLSSNSPGSLFRALPRYPLDDVADNDLPPRSGEDGHDVDSVIARESLCIKDCRNCWAILKEGFIHRKRLLPQDASKKRRGGAYGVQDPLDADLGQDRDTPAIVAQHAWPVLEWLVSLFEKDELLRDERSGERFSLLLLSQIPPLGGPRCEAGAPLDIIFHAVGQKDGERREMATRLLTLLINLTLSGSFDGPMFAATLTTRLYTSPPELVQNLLESLPKTVPVLKFKITVCQKFLSSGASVNGGSKPRPRPLPKRGLQHVLGATSSAMDADAGRAGSSLPPRQTLVTCSEVFRLLRSNHTSQESASVPPVLTVKYSLLVSYGHLQGLLPPVERDADWKDALRTGELEGVVDTAFPNNSTYHAALTIVSKLWLPG